MNFTPTNSEVYYGISINNFNNFKHSVNEIKKLTDEYGNFQVLENSQENINRFNELDSQSRESLYVAIVFQAFSIEAYINFVAVNTYEEDEFFGKFEQKSTIKKLKKIFSEKLKIDFDSNLELKKKIEHLFILRDNLVHFKSRNINLTKLKENPESYDPYESLSMHYDGVDEIIDTYPILKECVTSSLGHDLLENQMENLNKSLENTISEMFSQMLNN